MSRIVRTKSSGAGLAVVVGALIVTSAAGYFIKNRRQEDSNSEREVRFTPISPSDVVCEVIEEGKGRIPKNLRAETGIEYDPAAWVLLRVTARGKALRHAVQTDAEDDQGHRYTALQHAVGGDLLVTVPRGYSWKPGKAQLNCGFRGETIAKLPLPALPSPKRVVPATLEPLNWENIELEPVFVKRPTSEQSVAGVLAKAKLPTGHGLNIIHEASTYNEREPVQAKAFLSSESPEIALPLTLQYPLSVDSVRLRVQEVSMRKKRIKAKFTGLRVLEGTARTLVGGVGLTPPGVEPEFHLISMAIPNPAEGMRDSITFTLVSRQSFADLQIKGIEPGVIDGAKVMVGVRVARTAGSGTENVFVGSGPGIKSKPGQPMPLELDLEVSENVVIREKVVTLRLDPKKMAFRSLTPRTSLSDGGVTFVLTD